VDPDGIVAVAWPKVRADGHAGEVVAVLARTRAARAG
jgi:peroxiredoxin